MIKNKKPAVAMRYRIRVNLKKMISILHPSIDLFNTWVERFNVQARPPRPGLGTGRAGWNPGRRAGALSPRAEPGTDQFR